MMRLAVTSVYVDDTRLMPSNRGPGVREEKRHPRSARRGTVGADGAGRVELVLEPDSNPIARSCQSALFEGRDTHTTLAASDIHAE